MQGKELKCSLLSFVCSVLLFSFTVVGFCEEIKNDPKADKGVGPVKNVKLSPIDPKLVELGEKNLHVKMQCLP